MGRALQALPSGRRVRAGDDSGQVFHPSLSWRSAGRPWWRPKGNAALLFEVIPLAKYLVTGDHYVAVSPSGRSLPVGETWRYSVWRVIPSSLHSSATLVSLFAMAALARASLAGVIL